MSEELSVRSAALALLRRQLESSDSTADDILLPLRGLQRMGLNNTDLQVHVERIRAINDVTDNSRVIENNAVLALEMIEGLLSEYSLRWDPAAMAQVYLPKVLNSDILKRGLATALRPSDLLPPRADVTLSGKQVTDILNIVLMRLMGFEREPQRADFYRVPKAGLTTRPAALLALEDCITWEGLASQIADRLEGTLPNTVIWPRPSATEASYSSFAVIPEQWEGAYTVLADIESYYECVDHVLLATFIGGQLSAPVSYTRALESFLDAIMAASSGIPQGPSASETFASAYLLTIDNVLYKNGWVFARYADDYLIEANSVVDGKRKVEALETMLRELGLRLNASKTKIMRRETYLDNLRKPSQRVEQLRAEIRRNTEVQLLESTDSDEVDEFLREAGVDDEALWALFYTHTTTLEEVINEFREILQPPLIDAYAQYFIETAVSLLRREGIPSDMLTKEHDLRECLVVMSSAGHRVNLSLVSETLKWFPHLAQHTAVYLKSIVQADADSVRRLIMDWLNPVSDTDWVTAWLCNVPESHPEIIDTSLQALMTSLVRDSNVGLLTRTGAARALAAGLMLDSDSYRQLFREATPAIRSELFWTRWAAPERYPQDVPAIEAEDQVRIHAVYYGQRAEGIYNPSTGRIDIISGPAQKATGYKPSRAAKDVILAVNELRGVTGTGSRNGWDFWIVTATGEPLQSIRYKPMPGLPP
jgi:hypothetical protein